MVDHVDSDGADQIRACTRKKGYPSEDVARLAIASIRRTSPFAELRTYGCRHCGLWHVGGVPLRERRPGRVVHFEDEDAESRLDRSRVRRGRERRRAYGSGYIRRPSSQRREREEES